jgi:trehalose synthase-fused probable maltokinase
MIESPPQTRPWWSERAQAIEVAVRALPTYLPKQRWYPAKDAGPPTVALKCLIPLDCRTGHAAIATWQATPPGRSPISLFLPLAVIPADEVDPAYPGLIGKLNSEEALVDGFVSDSFVRCFVKSILHSAQENGGLQFSASGKRSALDDISCSHWSVARSTVEQSNTSVRVGNHAMLKAIRRLLPGMHPELEMSRFFLGSRFDAVPALLGWAELQGSTIAVLQEFVPNQGDGWNWIQARLRAAGTQSARTLPWIERLGARTAQMHCALARPSHSAAFNAEATRSEDWDRWALDLTTMLSHVGEALQSAAGGLDADTREAAQEFHRRQGDLSQLARDCISPAPVWTKTRHHGDFHLGQVLVNGDDCVIVDFEGEPLRPLSERRAKQVPLRDVAGMLRSLEYAAATLKRELPCALPAPARVDVKRRADTWVKEASWIFVESYLRTAGLMGEQPLDERTARRIITFFTLQKALYEVLYELANRPSWVGIPLRGALGLLSELQL